MKKIEDMTLEEVREGLLRRGQVDRFLNDVDREIIVDQLHEWNYNWLYDEGAGEAIDMLTNTIFCLSVSTDKELIEEAKNAYKDEEIDEDSDHRMIRVMNLLYTYQLEEEVLV